MNLQMLYYFIQVAKEQSITKAATKLFISQPALSKQIKKLEGVLGFLVLRRSSKGIELTERGEALFQDLEPLFSDVHRAIEKHMDHETIHLGCAPTESSYYLPAHYRRLHSANVIIPDVLDNDKDLIPLLFDTKLDAAIIQDVPSYKGLFSHFLFEDQFEIAVPIDHQLAKQSKVSIDECLAETLILPLSSTPLHQRVMTLIEQRKVTPKKVMETSWHNVVAFTAGGYGISFIPGIMANYIELRGVRFLPIVDYTPTRNLYLFSVNRSILDVLVYALSA
ncbi:LysR family transcriptional regulator [Salicibibacter cibarius]|uniref:LysR family transcriptional regulator n=1 Tax=Salicibibacter cibarius TaxID=2743000 RepID=A0A7T6Z3P0_9BACI|nr:LysR family transcriptional regulator [Salicibibacter cibarius]QQK76207.1 LysR family transcriptional regulator [Salicibibacter cibarius]